MYDYLQVLVRTWQKGVEEIQEEIFCFGAGMSPSFLVIIVKYVQDMVEYQFMRIFSSKMLETSIGKRAGFMK